MTVENNEHGGYYVVGTAFDEAKWAEIIEHCIACGAFMKVQFSPSGLRITSVSNNGPNDVHCVCKKLRWRNIYHVQHAT
eukprot:scaffold3341_cov270-Chaetoceros_neogracile.AAC.18